ncbi:hypothetical protein LRR18_16685, partial [Mangrovimonas sp. AS39]
MTSCSTVIELPLPSSNVHVIVCVPWVLYVKGSDVVAVMVPAQLSVVVGAVAVAAHCSVIVERTGETGSCV